MWGFLCGFLIPVGVAIALGIRLRDLGLTIGDWIFGSVFVLVGLVVMAVFGFWAAKQPEFQAYYASIAAQHQSAPLLFWLSLLAYMTGWEFLFRGFLLFGISGMPKRVEIFPRTLKSWFAIGFSTLLFGLSHWSKPLPEFLGSFLAGVILCLAAWRTHSCLAPMLLHTLVFGIFVVLVL
jgi:membrane protease YdiL (CAAX protease family)